VQQAPGEMPHPARGSGGPILPPMAPPQPSWKQEPRPEAGPDTGKNESNQ
jgi:hypothetical protein